jgi:hypothetical protein
MFSKKRKCHLFENNAAKGVGGNFVVWKIRKCTPLLDFSDIRIEKKKRRKKAKILTSFSCFLI